MDPISGAAAGLSALTGIVGGIVGSRGRKREQRAAKAEMAANKAAYQNLDTSNPYANVQNVYEDLTVNTQAADFAAQQQQQGLANTMGSMSGAAGGSGIAALAQAMAGQQSANMQQASASIAQQEQSNQQLAMQGADQAQQMRLQGEVMSRQMEADKIGTLTSMSQSRLADANAAREQAKSTMIGGVSQAAGSMAALGLDDHAIGAYNHAIGLDSSNAKSYFNLGALHERKGSIEEATSCFVKALENDSTYTKAAERLAIIADSNGINPHRSFNAKVAITVSPAPETS